MTMKKPVSRQGVLLTLGITFISLIVLSFATLILRNAENSDVRLTELSSVDRLYTLTSSLERSVSRSYYPLTGINLTLNNDTIIIAKDTKRRNGPPDYFQPPATTDPANFDMKSSGIFVQMLAESLTYKTTTLSNYFSAAFINSLILLFHYPSFNPNFLEAFMLYSYNDGPINLTKDFDLRPVAAAQQYCCYEINNNTAIYPVNSTYQTFFLGNNLSQLKEIHIKIYHPTRCPIINWSSTGRRLSGAADPARGEVNVKITVSAESKDPCLPQGSYFFDTQTDAILNRTIGAPIALSQVIFFDNLTNDPNIPGYDWISIYGGDLPTSSSSKERPMAFIYDSPGANPVSGSSFLSNILYLVQYDNPIRWDVTLKFEVGPVEVYSTEMISASLPPLNVSRIQRSARFK